MHLSAIDQHNNFVMIYVMFLKIKHLLLIDAGNSNYSIEGDIEYSRLFY